MKYFERQQELPYHIWTYYLVVTVATVGYGDIAPHTTQGRLCAMGIILFAIISIPQQTNDLIEKMARYSIYSRLHYNPRSHNKHVLICGDLKSISLREFFAELFHEDHENMNLIAVVLNNGKFML
jgi:hypothetical protein